MSRTLTGEYNIDGELSSGVLYTGKLALDATKKYYLEQYGITPETIYTWHHFTPLPRAFEPHLALQGKTFTPSTAPAILENLTHPWLGPYYYPGDHPYCRCMITVELR